LQFKSIYYCCYLSIAFIILVMVFVLGFRGRVIMISKENNVAYDRPKLSKAMNIELDKILIRKVSLSLVLCSCWCFGARHIGVM